MTDPTPTPKPPKYTLCISLGDLQENYRAIYAQDGTPNGTPPSLLDIDPSFYNLARRTFLLPRTGLGHCEDNTALRQPIPYGVLLDSDNRIFVYSRGGEGGEGKLIGKLSIGMGGHVDYVPSEGQHLLELLVDEGNRELGEEGGLPPAALNFVKLIADTDPVGCVHCGLLFIRNVTAEEKAALAPEAGCIEKGEWLTIKELFSPAIMGRLEGWSVLAARYMAAQLGYVDGPVDDADWPEDAEEACSTCGDVACSTNDNGGTL